MPREEKTYIKVKPEAKDFLIRDDVELLENQIKRNLKLSNMKAPRISSKLNRLIPYKVVFDKSNISNNKIKNLNINISKKKVDDDPYEQLKQLIQQGRLINEAVKKLQTMNFEDLNSNSEDEENNPFNYRKKIYYYDSEDEPLPSVYESL